MAIQVKCSVCGRVIRAGDHLAGKVVRCPDCRETVTVPGAALALDAGEEDFEPPASPGDAPRQADTTSSRGPWRDSDEPVTPTSAPAAANSSVSSPRVYSPTDPAIWFVKTPDEQVLGPLPRSQLDNWAEDGRLHPNSRVWAEGGKESYWAGQLYPFLVPSVPQSQSGTATMMLNADAYLPRDTTADEIRLERRRRRRQRRTWDRMVFYFGLIPIWAYWTTLVTGLMLASLIGMVTSPQVAAVFTLGWYLLGSAVVAYSLLMILFAAGNEDWFCLMLIFICPGYIWYYMVTRWDDLLAFILLQLLGIGFLLFGTMILGYWHQSLWFDF